MLGTNGLFSSEYEGSLSNQEQAQRLSGGNDARANWKTLHVHAKRMYANLFPWAAKLPQFFRHDGAKRENKGGTSKHCAVPLAPLIELTELIYVSAVKTHEPRDLKEFGQSEVLHGDIPEMRMQSLGSQPAQPPGIWGEHSTSEHLPPAAARQSLGIAAPRLEFREFLPVGKRIANDV